MNKSVSLKNTETSNKNHLLVNEKGDVGMAKHTLKGTETRDELSITLYMQSEIHFCSVRSMPDAITA